MKLFRTSNIDIAKICLAQFSFHLYSAVLEQHDKSSKKASLSLYLCIV